jgi:uncharacterized protein (TIGR02677 family)
MDSFQAISETAYLTAQNAPIYRRIMRSFFYEYEKMHFQLYKEDVLALLQSYPEYANYSLDQLKLDLDSLVAWKSLSAMQDPKRVYTIADYKNKQYRYAMTEAAVEIERLTVKLENLFIEKGNLSTNLFMRIYAAVEAAKTMQNKTLKEINEWWHDLQNDFKQLNQNYQDYLREFYSGKNEKLMKSLEFIQRKDLFVAYLTDFIRELQDKETLISVSLRDADPVVRENLLEKVIESELTVPHLNVEERTYLEEHIHDNVYGRWQTFMDWFFPHNGRSSECERILEITNEIIRHIIQNAALIVQLQNWGLSRKDDYIHYMDMFSKCRNIGEAHKLAAYVFGIQQLRHYRINGDRSTDSINSSPYEEVPMTYVIEPRVRTYKPRVDREGIPSRAWAKAQLREEYLEKGRHDREMVLKYIHNNRLAVADITDCVPSTVRITLLRWISAANTTTNKMGQTEYGQVFRLEQGDGHCVLHCEDGDLTMPAYTFVFEENNHA